MVVKVDVDEADELAGDYDVTSVPRLLFFKVREGWIRHIGHLHASPQRWL